MPLPPPGSDPSPLARLRRWGTRHPFWYFTVPAVAWVIFLMLAELLPSSDLPQINFPLADKCEHFACYGILGALLLRGWARRDRPRFGQILAITLIAGAWGMYLELMQGLTGYRDFELWDEAANFTGTVAGVAVWTWFGARWPAGDGEMDPTGSELLTAKESETETE